jgi:putative FmdB family regulatory protein
MFGRSPALPLYEYHCVKDGTFELVRKFSDPPLEKCPTCGGPIEKLLSAPAIQFKGTGWYITDYARKGDSAGAKDGAGVKKDGGAASDKPSSGSSDSSSGASATSSTSDSKPASSGSGSGSGSDKK